VTGDADSGGEGIQYGGQVVVLTFQAVRGLVPRSPLAAAIHQPAREGAVEPVGHCGPPGPRRRTSRDQDDVLAASRHLLDDEFRAVGRHDPTELTDLLGDGSDRDVEHDDPPTAWIQ
jgi:hypothetical protein